MSDTRKALTPCPTCGEGLGVYLVMRSPPIYVGDHAIYQFEKDLTAWESYTIKRCPKCDYQERLKDE